MQSQTIIFEETTGLKESKRILIIRSATRVFNPTLEALKIEFPDAHITVLAPESNSAFLEKDPKVNTVISLPVKNRMGIFWCGRNLINKLRSQKFNLAVVLYNVEIGVGYSNIDLLAWFIKPDEIRGYNSKGTYSTISGKSILKKIASEKTSSIWVVINIVATMILFICITAGILAEAFFRKFFQQNNKKSLIKSKS